MSDLINLDDAAKFGIFSSATHILLELGCDDIQSVLPEITFKTCSITSDKMIRFSVSKIPTVRSQGHAGKYNTRVCGSVGGFVPMGQVVCSKCRTKQYKNSNGLSKKHRCIEKC
jgi:hypothetical protein